MNLADAEVSIAIGLVGGVVGWVLSRGLFAPRIAWSSGISRKDGGDGAAYRFKIQNVGWFRSAMDLRTTAKLYYWVNATTNNIVDIPISTNNLDYLTPGANAIEFLKTSDISDFARHQLAQAGHESVARTASPLLEDLLALAPHDGPRPAQQPFLVLHALVTDGWTGSVRFRQSVRYYAEDIRTDAAFRAKVGVVARSWRRWRTASARLRRAAYRSRARGLARPSLTLVRTENQRKR